MASSVTADRTTFLSLPAELRDEIYTLSGCLEDKPCLTCGRMFIGDYAPTHIESYDRAKRGSRHTAPDQIWVYPDSFVNTDESNTRRALLPPPLTRVSKQVRADTIPMYYGKLGIHFDWKGPSWVRDLRQLREWLTAVGPGVAASLREVKIETNKYGPELEKLEALVSLGIRPERLRIEGAE